MKQKILLLIIGIILFNLPTSAYWHQLYELGHDGEWVTVNHGVCGDSSKLYAPMSLGNGGMVLRSLDLGATWDTV